VSALIDEILKPDQQAPPHAAPYRASHLGADHPTAVGLRDRQVDGAAVRAGAEKDGWAPEAFVPEQYAWGDEGAGRLYEANVDLDDVRVTVQVLLADAATVKELRAAIGLTRERLAAAQQALQLKATCTIDREFGARPG
jgi:hypothetical protein